MAVERLQVRPSFCLLAYPQYGVNPPFRPLTCQRQFAFLTLSGDDGTRTHTFLNAIEAISQLIYIPGFFSLLPSFLIIPTFVMNLRVFSLEDNTRLAALSTIFVHSLMRLS
jgi:hypothetical protein